jgi:hypothetical protein
VICIFNCDQILVDKDGVLMFQAYAILGGDFWQMEVPLRVFSTTEEAGGYVKGDFKFDLIGVRSGVFSFFVCDSMGDLIVPDSNVLVSEVIFSYDGKLVSPGELGEYGKVSKEIIESGRALSLCISEFEPSDLKVSDIVQTYSSRLLIDLLGFSLKGFG